MNVTVMGLRGAGWGTVLAALLVASPAVVAQESSKRPIRLIVAVAPAGSTDIIARLVAARLGDRLGQQIVVDNRPGAGGLIGVELVARSQPDGHTLLLGSGSLGTINSFFPKAPFHVQKDLEPIALLATSPYLLVVQPALPVRSVKELIGYAKANPGKLTYSGSTVTSLQRLSGEHLKRMAGIDMLFVPYKGTGVLMPDLLAGRLDVAFDNVLVLATHVKSGALRALAVTGAKRSVVMPDLPTISEAGVPGFQAAGWFGVLGAANTPQPIVARLNRELSALMSEQSLRDRLIAQGAEPLAGPPDAMRKYLASEIEKWGKLIREVGLKVD